MSVPMVELTAQHLWLWGGLFLLVSPWLVLVVLRKRLLPGKLPHMADPVATVQNEASRSLRRLSREKNSVLIREEARRKLLQFQSKVRFSEAETRRNHEIELIRLLEEAARYGITVTPDENWVGAV